MTPRQRMIAWGVIAGVHVLVLGGLLIAKIAKPPAPSETTLMVNLISEAPAAPPESTPTPPEPTPLPQMVTTPKPTMSAMTAPPMEEPRKESVAPQAAPSAPAAPAAAAPAVASVTPPNFTAAYLNNAIVYPVASRRKREEGVVRLKVLVNANGTADQVLLDRTSGSATLDQAALDVVKKRWRFAPAKQAGQPVSAWVIVPLEFKLTN